MTVQLLKTRAPEEMLQTTGKKIAVSATSPSPRRHLEAALTAIDGWAPTLRMATVVILLVGGLTGVSMLISIQAVVAGVGLGTLAAAGAALVVTSAIRNAPATVSPWLPPDAINWQDVDPQTDDTSTQRQVIHLKGW